jgi:hypothetical protein
MSCATCNVIFAGEEMDVVLNPPGALTEATRDCGILHGRSRRLQSHLAAGLFRLAGRMRKKKSVGLLLESPGRIGKAANTLVALAKFFQDLDSFVLYFTMFRRT